MIINNPQDLTPLLTAMREGLQADMNTLTANVQAENNALSQSVSADIDALTVVNGEISTEVQAINGHTTAAINSRTYKKPLFIPVNGGSISCTYISGNYGARTLIELTGVGVITGFSKSSRISVTECVVDGVDIASDILSKMAVLGGLHFEQSVVIKLDRAAYGYTDSATIGYLLGGYSWK